METAAQNVKELQGGTALTLSKDIHKVTPQLKGKHARLAPQSTEKSDHICFKCGRAGHLASMCKFKDDWCFHCGKTGHVQAVCYGKAKGTDKKSGPPRSVQQVQERWSPSSTHCFAWGQRTKAHYTT